MTAPRYRSIEFCRNIEVLWGKLETGDWDWLGVKPDGQFVLGSPSRRRSRARAAALTVTKAGAVEGEHGVRVEAPTGHPSWDWYASEQDAIAGYAERIAELTAQPGVHVHRVSRREGPFIVEQEYVLRKETTYRGRTH